MRLDCLTIVTCCTPSYATYLPEWAESLAAMTMHPAEVCIVLVGEDDQVEPQVAACLGVLAAAGIQARVRVIGPSNIGHARNVAVSMASTEWVQHFDCDDLAMPHMLEEARKYMRDADVIALGYERSGDLASGPAIRRKLYRPSRGKTTLESGAPASGVSPFRRRFWERSPYPEDMEGGWDTALWLGFAHQNARFVPTGRHCFWYRQHADSTFNKRRLDTRKTAKVGTRLQSLRRGDMGTSLIVPLSDANPSSRQDSWDWLRQRYRALLPELEIVTAVYAGRPWCKGAAVNDAVARSTGEVLVIADADCWVAPHAIREAVEAVRTGAAPWVVPHGDVHRMDMESTDRVTALEPSAGIDQVLQGAELIRRPYRGYAGGGVVVVSRPGFDYAGGFPDQFLGWGCEDEAFAVALDTLLGPHLRLGADLWHFWHPQGPRNADVHYRRNRQLLASYRLASGDEDAMWRVVTGRPDRPMTVHYRRLKEARRRIRGAA